MKAPSVTPAIENYLMAIYVLGEGIQPVIAARVAEEMGISPSILFSTLRRLERELCKGGAAQEIRLNDQSLFGI